MALSPPLGLLELQECQVFVKICSFWGWGYTGLCGIIWDYIGTMAERTETTAEYRGDILFFVVVGLADD